jgi:hypothetical protein
MTTTPTFWMKAATFSNDVFAQGPKVVPLDDDSFAFTWESQGDLVGRHLDAQGSFTDGNFLADLSGSSAKPLFGAEIFQQDDGRVVVAYNQQFDDNPLDNDVRWHSVNPDPDNNSFAIENSGNNEEMLDATEHLYGNGQSGSAVVYSYDTAGGNFLMLRLLDGVGNQLSNQIFVGNHAGQIQQRASITHALSGSLIVAYENFTPASGASDVRFHLFTKDGVDASGDVIASAGNLHAGFPDVVEGKNHDFIVAWSQDGGIAFRRYDSALHAYDANPTAIDGTATGVTPKITALNDGGYMIGWAQKLGVESDGSADFRHHAATRRRQWLAHWRQGHHRQPWRSRPPPSTV